MAEALNDSEMSVQPLASPIEKDSSDQKEFDFIERPSEDFFCPVTLELLLDPHQTRCCGNHLSEKVVLRLQRDGKPCPMCKNPQLDAAPDKFHGRKVKAVCVRCPHKVNGCEWVGEVSGFQRHVDCCPRRLWKCQYCEFASTYDVLANHEEQCTHYPLPCPNKCEIGTIPRCDMENHCKRCPLQLVSCECADVGCDVKIARRDLRKHMEESQQQHLLSATFLNIKLTREIIVEKDRQLVEKEKIIKRKDNIIASKEKQLLELQEQLKFLQASMDHIKVGVDHLLGGTKHYQLFTVDNASKLGIWYSEPFYSHSSGYKLKLFVTIPSNIAYGFATAAVGPPGPVTSGAAVGAAIGAGVGAVGVGAAVGAAAGALYSAISGSKNTRAMFVGLVLCKGEYDHQLSWPVTFYVDLQLLAQVKQVKHVQESYEYFFLKPCEGRESNRSEHRQFMSSSILYPEKQERSPYINENNSMELRLWVHI